MKLPNKHIHKWTLEEHYIEEYRGMGISPNTYISVLRCKKCLKIKILRDNI